MQTSLLRDVRAALADWWSLVNAQVSFRYGAARRAFLVVSPTLPFMCLPCVVQVARLGARAPSRGPRPSQSPTGANAVGVGDHASNALPLSSLAAAPANVDQRAAVPEDSGVFSEGEDYWQAGDDGWCQNCGNERRDGVCVLCGSTPAAMFEPLPLTSSADAPNGRLASTGQPAEDFLFHRTMQSAPKSVSPHPAVGAKPLSGDPVDEGAFSSGHESYEDDADFFMDGSVPESQNHRELLAVTLAAAQASAPGSLWSSGARKH
jgi:hypothetical protein